MKHIVIVLDEDLLGLPLKRYTQNPCSIETLHAY